MCPLTDIATSFLDKNLILVNTLTMCFIISVSSHITSLKSELRLGKYVLLIQILFTKDNCER